MKQPKATEPEDAPAQIPCGVPWCIGIAPSGRQFCRVHENSNLRTQFPSPASRELEMRFLEAMRGTPARNVDARR